MKRVLAALAVSLVLLAGCSSSPSEKAKTLDHVVYVDSVGGAGRDGYAYVARRDGFFEQEGLEVEIQPGSGTGENLKNLISGKAQFSALDGTGGIIAAGKTHSTNKMIMLVHPQTLASIITMDPTIGNFGDLEGRKIAMNAGGVNDLLFPALAKVAGFDASKVTIERTKGVGPLVSALAGCQVAAVSTFLVQQPQIEAAAKQHPCPGWEANASVLPYGNVMSGTIGTAIWASDAIIAKDPDLVKRFQRAMKRGLEFSAKHENFEATAAAVNQSVPGTSIDSALGEIRTVGPYIAQTGPELGTLTRSQVAKVIALLGQNKLLPNPVTPEDVAWPGLVPVI